MKNFKLLILTGMILAQSQASLAMLSADDFNKTIDDEIHQQREVASSIEKQVGSPHNTIDKRTIHDSGFVQDQKSAATKVQ